MNDVLGAGMTSRLFREVRERRGLAYSVSSGYGYLADAGVFNISAGVNREQLTETISVCIDEAERLATDLVPDDELRKAKDHNLGRFRLSLETAFSLGQRHGELLITKDEIESIDDVVAQVEAITAEDVRAVAQRILARGKLHASVVGPDITVDEVEAALG
jgi:predicted Zn-dependent peptidase